jgi:hypothetical protein
MLQNVAAKYSGSTYVASNVVLRAEIFSTARAHVLKYTTILVACNN